MFQIPAGSTGTLYVPRLTPALLPDISFLQTRVDHFWSVYLSIDCFLETYFSFLEVVIECCIEIKLPQFVMDATSFLWSVTDYSHHAECDHFRFETVLVLSVPIEVELSLAEMIIPVKDVSTFRYGINFIGSKNVVRAHELRQTDVYANGSRISDIAAQTRKLFRYSSMKVPWARWETVCLLDYARLFSTSGPFLLSSLFYCATASVLVRSKVSSWAVPSCFSATSKK